MKKKKDELERISLVIYKKQHEEVIAKGLNFSALVRDLLEDYLSDKKIHLSLSEATTELYNQVVSNTGASDSEFEPYLKKAINQMLKDRIKIMEQITKRLDQEEKS